jgi:hypothetical protein
MTKFFTKPKAHVNGTKLQEAAVPGPSSLQSDFERVFKPFALGKDKTLAPQNWFHDQKMRRRRTSKLKSKVEVIVLDSEDECDVETIEPSTNRRGTQIHDSSRYVQVPYPLPLHLSHLY